MSDWLMRLVCAAIVCAVIRAIAGEGQGLRKLICGMYLALTVLSVPMELELPELDPGKIAREANSAVRDGAQQAEAAREAIIIEAVEAYIWNEAAGLSPELEIRVELGEDQAPETVTLTGTVGTWEQTQLTQDLARELGISEEDVIWIQPNQSSE